MNHTAFLHQSNCATVSASKNHKNVIVCGGREVDEIIVALGLCTVHIISLLRGTAGVIMCRATVFVIIAKKGCGLIGYFVKVGPTPSQHVLHPGHATVPSCHFLHVH